MGRTALQSSVVRKSAQGMGESSPMYHVALCVCSLQPSACKVSWARFGSSSGARLSHLPLDIQPRPRSGRQLASLPPGNVASWLLRRQTLCRQGAELPAERESFLILYFVGRNRSCCLGPWKLARPLRTVICKNLLTFRNTHFLCSCHPTLGISPAETKALECKAIGTGCLLSLVCGRKSLEVIGKSIGTRKVEEVNDIHLFGISTF